MMSQTTSDIRGLADHAAKAACELEDPRCAAIVGPLAAAIRALADQIDTHDRSLHSAFNAIGP